METYSKARIAVLSVGVIPCPAGDYRYRALTEGDMKNSKRLFCLLALLLLAFARIGAIVNYQRPIVEVSAMAGIFTGLIAGIAKR